MLLPDPSNNHLQWWGMSVEAVFLKAHDETVAHVSQSSDDQKLKIRV